MSGFVLDTPVAMLLFNRPELTAQVFAAVRLARPRRLLLVADGPRPGRAGEEELCAEARRVVEQVDWPCEVTRNFSPVNLGCRERVSSGLDWVFSEVEEAIILEDDCLPDPSFFRFCQEMLARHREDERVMMICGTNFMRSWKEQQQSYHYSNNDCVWGWASWRRAWRHYDVSIGLWGSDAGRRKIREVLEDPRHYAMWAANFEEVFRKRLDTWDYQWTFARMLRRGVAVIPSRNLISNTGFGLVATHTKVEELDILNLPSRPLAFPLLHPVASEVDREFDAAIEAMFARRHTFLSRAVRLCRLLLLLMLLPGRGRAGGVLQQEPAAAAAPEAASGARPPGPR